LNKPAARTVSVACVVHRYGADNRRRIGAHCRLSPRHLSAADHGTSPSTKPALRSRQWQKPIAGRIVGNGVRSCGSGGAAAARFIVSPRSASLPQRLSIRGRAGNKVPREGPGLRRNSSTILDHGAGLRRPGDVSWAFRYAGSFFGCRWWPTRARYVPDRRGGDPAIKRCAERYFALPLRICFSPPEGAGAGRSACGGHRWRRRPSIGSG